MSLEKFCAYNSFGVICELVEGHDGPHQGVNIFNQVTQFVDGPVVINRAIYAIIPTKQTLEDVKLMDQHLENWGVADRLCNSWNRIKLLLGVTE